MQAFPCSLRHRTQRILRYLLEAGANPNDDETADTPLTAAARAGFTEGVRLLLNAGADVNLSSFFDTPLTAAVKRGDAKIINMLLAAGADVNAGGVETGKTALVAALGHNNLSLAHRLRRAGAIEKLPKYTCGKRTYGVNDKRFEEYLIFHYHAACIAK